jgi:hypothetical protein
MKPGSKLEQFLPHLALALAVCGGVPRHSQPISGRFSLSDNNPQIFNI